MMVPRHIASPTNFIAPSCIQCLPTCRKIGPAPGLAMKACRVTKPYPRGVQYAPVILLARVAISLMNSWRKFLILKQALNDKTPAISI